MLASFCRCHCPMLLKLELKVLEDTKSVLSESLRNFSVCPYAEEATPCSEQLETLKGYLQAAYDAVEKSLKTMSTLKAKKEAI